MSMIAEGSGSGRGQSGTPPAMRRETADTRSGQHRSIKVLVISDQPVLRLGLVRLFQGESHVEVCREAECASAALEQVAAIGPDLATIGLPLESKIHLELIAELKAKHPPLKVLAGIRHDDPSLVARLFRAGADGCVCWADPLTKITEAARTVLRGDFYVGSRSAKRLLKSALGGTSPANNGVESLTDREWNVFIMIGQGLTTRQIATDLDVSARTIESHRKKIKLKLGLQNATQLNHVAYRSWQENHR
jgi:DNA-binding NarL/FixJ family response regulator